MHTCFITGSASGFGLRTALGLLGAGHRVIATDLDVTGLEAALGGPDPRLLVRQLDVTDEAAVQAVAAEALAWGPVDVVVNNAGGAVWGTIEEAPMAAVRRLFDLNVFGLTLVTRAFLPALRANAGTFVNVSSVSGAVVFHESGFYAATKHAVEALCDALAQETAGFGVKLRVIQPGNFATRLPERAAAVSAPRDPAGPYAPYVAEWDSIRDAVLAPPQDPDLVAQAILATLDRPERVLRVPVGSDAFQALSDRPRPHPDAWRAHARVNVGR